MHSGLSRTILASVMLAGLVSALPAHAQFARMDDVIEYRQAALTLIATHFKRVGAVAKGEQAYDKAKLDADVQVLEALARLPWEAFPQGSNGSASKARAEVWSDKDKFKAAADKFQAEVHNLSAAAKTGQLDQIKSAFAATGKSCKACHESFKNKD